MYCSRLDYVIKFLNTGERGSVAVKALWYKQEVRGFDNR
jgi:hypothetical protein